MKRIYMTLVAILCVFAAMAQTCTISARDVTAIADGKTPFYLTLLINESEVGLVNGCGTVIEVPDGVTVNQVWDEDEEGYVNDFTAPAAKSSFTSMLVQSPEVPNRYTLAVASTGSTFKTSTKELAVIGFVVDSKMKNGDYQIKIGPTSFNKGTESVYPQETFKVKLTVSGGESSKTCTISAEDVEATADGKTPFYLTLLINESEAGLVNGCGTVIEVPKGVTVNQVWDEDEEGYVNDFTAPAAKSSFTSMLVQSPEVPNRYTLAVASTGSTFKTSTKELAVIGFVVDSKMKNGDYQIKIGPTSFNKGTESVYPQETFAVNLSVSGGESGEDSDDTDISKLDNVIYLEKTEGYIGSTATLSFKMKNTAAIRGFQFDLYLPDGVTAVKKDNGSIQAQLSSGRLPEYDEHTLSFSEEKEDGVIHFLCGSLNDETFTGSDGEILTLQVNIAKNMTDGDYPITIRNIRLTETDISKCYITENVKSTLVVFSYMVGDINGDGAVNVSDYIGVANHILGITQAVFIEKAGDVNGDNAINVSDYIGVANIILTGSPYGKTNNARPAYARAKDTDLSTMENVIYVESMTANAGTQATLSFMMKNTADIRGFNFDLYLPEGVTAVKNAKGRIQGSLSDGRLLEDDEHTLAISEQEDGAIRFLCGSQYDETFTGNEGEIATLQVNIAEDMVNGEYPIILKAMRLSESDISKYYDSDNVETTITIVGGVGIADILEDSNTQVIIYNLAGQRLAKPQQGINIINGKRIILK